MRSSYLRLYIHFVWSTYKRQDLIDEDLEQILKKLIEDKIIEYKSNLLAFGNTKDHIHLLVEIHPAVSISNLVKEIKGYSSYSIANRIRPNSFFRWQNRYGAMTVSQSDIVLLKLYIRNQKTHHGIHQPNSSWEFDNN